MEEFQSFLINQDDEQTLGLDFDQNDIQKVRTEARLLPIVCFGKGYLADEYVDMCVCASGLGFKVYYND